MTLRISLTQTHTHRPLYEHHGDTTRTSQPVRRRLATRTHLMVEPHTAHKANAPPLRGASVTRPNTLDALLFPPFGVRASTAPVSQPNPSWGRRWRRRCPTPAAAAVGAAAPRRPPWQHPALVSSRTPERHHITPTHSDFYQGTHPIRDTTTQPHSQSEREMALESYTPCAASGSSRPGWR